jgi:coproporphyrinogen III oxidase-like Fe-S oxidoreductase
MSHRLLSLPTQALAPEVEEPKVKEIITSKLRFGKIPVSCRRHPPWCHRICAYCVPDYAGKLL